MSQEHGRLMDHLTALLAASHLPVRREAAGRLAQLELVAEERRLRRADAGAPAPSLLFLSLTTRCGLACLHCSSAEYPRGVDLADEVADRTLTEAEELGIFICGLTGGEPLLHPGFFDLVARHDRQLLLLFTNGLLIDSEVADRLAALPHVLPILGIEGTEAVNDRLRGPGATRGVRESMKLLRARGIPFGFAATARPANLPDLLGVQFYLELMNAGARFAILLDCLPIGRAATSCQTLAPADRARLSQHLAELRRRSGAFIAYVPGDERGEGGCQAAADLLHVNALGQVEPCPFLHVSASAEPAPLEGALCSKLFDEIRRRAGMPDGAAPVPCFYLENRALLGDLVEVTGACETDPALRGFRPAENAAPAGK
ncbi:MAG: radical SAM protein [Planctomycetes bacterium]|nr:radical SAM protein [Planctomycetota bacterium]